MGIDTKMMEIAFIGLVWKWLELHKKPRIRDNTSLLTGAMYTHELLTGSPGQCYDLMRIPQKGFKFLCSHFKEKGWLADSRFVSVEEKIAMFCVILAHNQRFIVIKRRFQHSTQTVHKYFHEVLAAMMEFAREMIVPTTWNEPLEQIKHHKRLRGIFKGAVGALDGTLIHAIVPIEKQIPYRGRARGECYQNVLGVCDFNMLFTYIWPGWEGTVHDSRVLHAVISDPSNNFPLPPPDMYYLGDAAYTNKRYFLTPYRNIRYWLADFRRRAPNMTRGEVFNHAHAKLRNVIERSFGVLKQRFAILNRMAPFTFNVQRDIVISTFAMHNYLRRLTIQGIISDRLFDTYENNNVDLGTSTEEGDGDDISYVEPPLPELGDSEDEAFMGQLREQLADALMV